MDEFIDSSHTLYAIYVKVPCEYNIEIGRLGVINLDKDTLDYLRPYY
ncbi:hypothetical protein WMO40_17540 [Bacillaceae bacterium CLA-AA-H227]|uniref:Uncharacterized protein n=1 Tax=Robertmurraya yapensis (ex Hitch et al 2024) TaxID=3133160 RepID=A0ACC6SHE8_9BACI|nr:hypothetical protein [Bacillus yapensis]